MTMNSERDARAPLLRGVRQGRLLRRLEDRGGFLGDRGPLEEARVLRAPQPHRVGKGEVAEIVEADMAVLDQLPGFGQRIAHVDDAEMPDTRLEIGVAPAPTRIVFAN